MRYRLPEKGNYKVFANIPFFLTTQIVEKLTQGKNAPSDMWLVMEKGRQNGSWACLWRRRSLWNLRCGGR